jgi:hypothetical protein
MRGFAGGYERTRRGGARSVEGNRDNREISIL